VVAMAEEKWAKNRTYEKYIGNLLDTYHWELFASITKKASDAIFSVMYVAAPAFQEKYLPDLEKAAANAVFDAGQYAVILDAAKGRQFKMQLYGTYFVATEFGNIHPFPIWREHEVNQRRQMLGLPPLEDYYGAIEKEYKLPENDPFANHTPIFCILTDQEDKALEGVKVYYEKQLIGTSLSDGHFFGAVPTKTRTGFIRLEKEGYEVVTINLKQIPNTEVLHIDIGLRSVDF
jgi:hypothetical protein